MFPTPARARGVAAIGWSGEAMVFEGARVLQFTVCTRVEPFRRVRSTSWLTSKGEASARTIVIDPDGGWLEQAGARTPLSPALIAHERQQYGVYGYLLGLGTQLREGSVVRASEPGFPPIRLEHDGRRVIAADYNVASPEDGHPLAQRFAFDGELAEHGVRWFRRMTIEQSGRRYFQLWINELFVERS